LGRGRSGRVFEGVFAAFAVRVFTFIVLIIEDGSVLSNSSRNPEVIDAEGILFGGLYQFGLEFTHQAGTVERDEQQ
jgi:hypothetical protein